MAFPKIVDLFLRRTLLKNSGLILEKTDIDNCKWKHKDKIKEEYGPSRCSSRMQEEYVLYQCSK